MNLRINNSYFKNKFFFICFKLIFLTLIIYYIFKKIDYQLILDNLREISIPNLLISAILINISYIFSSIRLYIYFRSKNIFISLKDTINLNYRGIFFNNFLPSGIGGDGYKILILKKYNYKVKELLQLLLSDRANGLLIILLTLIILLPYLNLNLEYFQYTPFLHNKALITILILFVLLCFRIGTKFICNETLITSIKAIGLSAIIQIAILFAQMSLLASFKIELFNINYLWAILLSFLGLLLPITIGHSGIKEIVILFASYYIVLDPNIAISGSIAFFLLNLLISFLASLFFLIKLTIR